MNIPQQAQRQRLLNLRKLILILTIGCFICSVCSLCSAPFDDFIFVCGDSCYNSGIYYGAHSANVALALSFLMAILGVIGVIVYLVVGKKQGKYEQAEPLHERALAINESMLGAEHPVTVQSLNNLANLYAEQGKYEQAEPLYQRALAIRERVLGAEHPDTKRVRKNYNELLQKMKRK